MRLRYVLPLLALVALPVEAAPAPVAPRASSSVSAPDHVDQTRPRKRRTARRTVRRSRTPYRAPSARPGRRSGVRTYSNSRGVRVQRPTYYDRAPSGASARCRDGTYSFSMSRRGTCSHHGGVGTWL